MRISTYLIAACFALGWTSAASAAVDVTFIHPERYTDASLRGAYGSGASDATLGAIRALFERLGDRYLKSGQTLKVAVLDVDLAGRYEPRRRYAYEVRIFREITWPRIKLRYSLEENGTTLLSAEETISDLNYLENPDVRYSSEQLPYEKAMLDDWFRSRFVEHRQPPA